LVGLLGRGISPTPTQGPYLHRTAQHRKTRTYIHSSSRIQTHDHRFPVVQDVRAIGRATTKAGAMSYLL